MTLGELFTYINNNSTPAILYFAGVPILASIVGLLSGKQSHTQPWTSLQSFFVYATCIPGVFALMLSLYFFFFERRSILDTNLILQILPLASMALTLYLIGKFVPLKLLPGFNRVGGLISMLAALMFIFWILDRMRIFVFSYMPIHYLLFLLVGLVLFIRYGWKQMSR